MDTPCPLQKTVVKSIHLFTHSFIHEIPFRAAVLKMWSVDRGGP